MKTKFVTLLTGIAALTFVACNNGGAGNASNDTANKNTSTQDHSSMADTLHMTTEAGNYLDPRVSNDSAAVVDPGTVENKNKKK